MTKPEAKTGGRDRAVPLKPNPAPALMAQVASLAELKEAASGCKACPLYAGATQTVFGDGASHPVMVLVGEQPGVTEDQEGSPFVGPAGKVLWTAADLAGIASDAVYTTNVVKHFKWTAGKWRRLHAKPNGREIEACMPWLEAEMEILKPTIVVGLGAMACQAMLGPNMRVTKERGRIMPWRGLPVLITLHSSAILRARDAGARELMMDQLVSDLELAREQAA